MAGFEVNDNGVSIQTFEEALETIQQDWRDSPLGAGVATKVDSVFGIIQRVFALRYQQMQEAIMQLWQMVDARSNEGVAQDRTGALLGVIRLGDQKAEVIGDAYGTQGTIITDGTRLSVDTNVFDVIGGPYTIQPPDAENNQKVQIRLRAQVVGRLVTAGLGAWTIVDTIPGFDSFTQTSQPIAGRLQETATEYRARTEVERFRRAAGPLSAIEAAVSSVEGVTYVRAYDNTTVDPVDQNGIPLNAINVVVEGGEDSAIALAIRNSMPAGHATYGTDVSETVVVGPDSRVIKFDRVTSVPVWVEATHTTSTSEEPQLADLEDATIDALMDYTMGPVDPSTGSRSSLRGAWQIGADVLPARLVSVLSTLSGVDDVAIRTSIDGSSYAAGKRAMTTRQRAELAEVRITVLEN